MKTRPISLKQFMDNKRKSTSLISASLLWFIELSIYISQVRIEPNGIHDGIMFPGAVASSEGLIPNRDFFSQYGPITPILQGYWLKVFPVEIISLRILDAILLATIGLYLYVIGKKFISDLSAFLVSLFWAVAFPVFLPATLPWSTVLSTLLVLVVINFLISAERTQSSSNSNLYIPGFLLSISPLIRLHLISTLFIVTIIIIHFKDRLGKSRVRSYFSGLLTGIVAIILYFSSTRSFKDFYEQTIDFPLTAVAVRKGLFDSSAQIVSLLSSGVSVFLGIIFLSVLHYIYRFRKSHSTVLISRYFSILILGGVVALVLQFNLHTKPSFKNPTFIAMYISQNYLQLGTFVAFTLSLYYISEFAISLVLKRDVINYLDCLFVGISFSFLLQLYPSPDQLHLWWVAPVLILMCSYKVSTASANGFHTVAVNYLLAAFIGLNIIQLLTYTSHQDQYFVFGSLRHMSTASEPTEYEKTFRALSRYPVRSITFDCGDGIYAAPNGHYLAANPDYINWQNRDYLSENISGTIFGCQKSKEWVSRLRTESPYKIIEMLKLNDGLFDVIYSKE